MEQPTADDLAAAASYAAGRAVVAGLDGVTLAELSAGGRVDALVAWDKVIRWATANRDKVLAAMWAGQQGPSKDKEWAREDVATALRISPNYATDLLHNATELVDRLPETLGLLEAGELTTYQARVIAEAVAPLDAKAAAQVQRTAIAKSGLYAGQFRAAVQRAVLVADPAGVEERPARARSGRRVELRALEDGMGSIWSTLAGEDAVAVYRRLDDHAKNYPDDTRTADQKRADALVDLVTRGGGSGNKTGPLVQVSVALSTLARLDEQPADLDRYGPIAAEVARFLAADESAQWRMFLTDNQGRLLFDYGRTSYTPPAALRRFLEARDRTCRFPGCNRRADACETDHIERWEDLGQTNELNLHLLSGRHHHAKDDHGWKPTRQPDGSTDWRSPTGHHYLVPAATYPVDTSFADPDPPPY